MIGSYFREKIDLIDSELKKYFDELNYPTAISDGMKYSVLGGGKRIRPILLFMTLDLLKVDLKKGIPCATAIEFIHSYSLVHDDLPALDNDEFRRGELTTHAKFGEAEAILIGDALLTHAFYLLSEKNKNLLEAEKIIEIISLVSKYSGINGMIGGQMIDIESENKEINFETLKYIHSNKTGKLIKLPVEIGCIIGNLESEKKDALLKYAELIGLAFQIRDDILDVEGDFEKIGKAVGSDQELKKSTYPSIFGLDESKKILNKIGEEAKEIITQNFCDNNNSKLFLQLVEFIIEREK
ncbi:MAG: polyprenyl synthetase family protein [Fusobacteriaceae bacterium]